MKYMLPLKISAVSFLSESSKREKQKFIKDLSQCIIAWIS
jgi:hypothetical protein